MMAPIHLSCLSYNNLNNPGITWNRESRTREQFISILITISNIYKKELNLNEEDFLREKRIKIKIIIDKISCH